MTQAERVLHALLDQDFDTTCPDRPLRRETLDRWIATTAFNGFKTFRGEGQGLLALAFDDGSALLDLARPDGPFATDCLSASQACGRAGQQGLRHGLRRLSEGRRAAIPAQALSRLRGCVAEAETMLADAFGRLAKDEFRRLERELPSLRDVHAANGTWTMSFEDPMAPGDALLDCSSEDCLEVSAVCELAWLLDDPSTGLDSGWSCARGDRSAEPLPRGKEVGDLHVVRPGWDPGPRLAKSWVEVGDDEQAWFTEADAVATARRQIAELAVAEYQALADRWSAAVANVGQEPAKGNPTCP